MCLFAKCGPTVTELVLVNFQKANEKLDKHFFEKQFHKLVQAAMMFCKVQQNKLSIDQQLYTLRQERIVQNVSSRDHNFSVRQGIALRGCSISLYYLFVQF